MRRVDTVDVEHVTALPRLKRVGGPRGSSCARRCATSRRRTATCRSSSASPASASRSSPRRSRRSSRRELSETFIIKHPRLWAPRAPELYDASVTAVTNRERRGTYRLSFGVRKIETLPGRDHQAERQAAEPQGRQRPRGRRPGGRRALAAHPHAAHEPAEEPRRHDHALALPAPPRLHRGARPRRESCTGSTRRSTRCPTSNWEKSGVRKLALRAAELTVRNNINHPSILTWSLANEPSEAGPNLGVYGPSLVSYIRDASTAVRELDDTRLVGLDRQSRVGEPLTTDAHQYLDVLGVNEYFGWYRSVAENLPDLPSTTSADLSGYLDALHAANPDLPLVITEFGAEACALRTGRAEGHLRVPAQVRDGPPRDPRVEAVRERLDLLGAARLPRAPDLAGRCAGRSTPLRPGTTRASRGEQPPQAGVPQRRESVPPREAAPLACAAP